MSAGTLLAKAGRALPAARRALEQGDTETAADRAYYAVFYAGWALLDAEGHGRPKTHSGLVAEVSRVFVKPGRMEAAAAAIVARLHNLRLVADYTLQAVSLADAQRAVAEADAFISEAQRMPGERPAS